MDSKRPPVNSLIREATDLVPPSTMAVLTELTIASVSMSVISPCTAFITTGEIASLMWILINLAG
jgi:hypothetical protein